jgi:hypothetical protein
MSPNATSQHVAERDKRDVFIERKLYGLEHVLFRADANRASGARDEFDVAGYRRAQSGNRYRTLVAAADVHDAHGLIEVETL